MATTGALTRSGLLYEGNFEDWLTRIQDVLAVHGIRTFRVWCHGKRLVKLNWWSGRRLNQQAIHNVIAAHISPELIPQLPFPENLPTEQLLLQIQDRATPFRLLDLPAEIRECIFAMHFEEICRDLKVIPIDVQRACGIPRSAICYVSKQVRRETTPLAGRGAVFRLERIIQPPKCRDQRVVD